MSFAPNKYHSRCQRCGINLEPGQGYIIKRFRGYEIVCTSECLLTNLRAPNNLKIESRIKIPPITGVIKMEPYWQKAEFWLLTKMKEIFHGRQWEIVRSGNYSVSHGSDTDENGQLYCFVRATIRNVRRKNKKEIIFYC